MKSVRKLLLSAVVMTSVAMSAVDVEVYVTGDMVDADGNTLLHLLVENCDNSDFTLELKPFSMVQKNFSIELALLCECFEKIKTYPQEQQLSALMISVEEVMVKLDQNRSLKNATELLNLYQIKNNNGETVIDIITRKVNENPTSALYCLLNNIVEYAVANNIEL